MCTDREHLYTVRLCVFMYRTEEMMATPVRGGIIKSMSDPVNLSPTTQDQSNGRTSPYPSASVLQVSATNDSELRKSPSVERKKKSAFSKLLHPSKQKAP